MPNYGYLRKLRQYLLCICATLEVPDAVLGAWIYAQANQRIGPIRFGKPSDRGEYLHSDAKAREHPCFYPNSFAGPRYSTFGGYIHRR